MRKILFHFLISVPLIQAGGTNKMTGKKHGLLQYFICTDYTLPYRKKQYIIL
jgi:hypothetical protein